MQPATREPIIAFSKDWRSDHTSNHHVLRELAKRRRVLWLSSVATRAPTLASGRDLATIRRKLGEFARGAVNVENDLWVAQPLVLPLPHSRLARALNRQLLAGYLRMLRRRLAIDRFELWTFLPTVADYIGRFGEQRAVYYCVDEWSLFGYLDRDAIAASERALLARVDAVFAINEPLAAAKRAFCPATFVAPHGVDHGLFARALADDTAIPSDLAAIRAPRIGFYGTIREWVDLELVAAAARARPEWSFVLIGQTLADVSALAGIANVHLLGQRPHTALPAYCKGFAAGIIPYRIDDRMQFVNPLKLREYLSAGLAVVSTAVPEVARYSQWCEIADDARRFVTAIERVLASDDATKRRTRSAAMRSETWEARVATIEHQLAQLKDRHR